MTISSINTEISYAGDDASTVFPIPFPFDTSADLKVVRTDSDGNPVELSSGFSITGGSGSTGTLTLTTALAAGYTLTIIDDPERKQDIDYINNDSFPAESAESGFDRLTRIAKRTYNVHTRALRVIDGDPAAGDGMLLGSVENRKGKYLFFNDTTGAVEYAEAVDGATLSQSLIGQYLYPQSAEEASAGVTPTNYFYAVGNVKRYGAAGDAATNDTAAFQSAAAVVAEAGGTLFVPGGHYMIHAEIDFGAASNVLVWVAPDAIVDCSPVAASSTDNIFSVGEFSEAVKTTLTAAATEGDAALTVADSSAFADGDLIAVMSDAEYWGGVSGVSGFGVKTKGELLRIEDVPDGTTINVSGQVSESYSITGLTVTVVKCTKIENVHFVIQGELRGDGGGESHTGSNPTGMRAIRVIGGVNTSISGGGMFRNFPRVATQHQICHGVRVENMHYTGRKLDDAGNDSSISAWFTGAWFLGCNDVVFDGNTQAHGRRHYDPDDYSVFADGMVIGRRHVVSNNIARDCENVIGGHAVRNVTYIGNVGTDCGSGLRFRGRDVTVIGNDFGYCTNGGIIVGGATSSAYPVDSSPNVGNVVILGNKMRCGGRGLLVRDDVESLKDDNNHYVCNLAAGSPVGYGALIQGRRTRNVYIGRGTLFDLSGRQDNAVGIDFPNASDSRYVLENIQVYATIKGAYEGVHFSGVEFDVGDGKANGLDVDVTLMDCENIGIELATGSFDNDGFSYFGKDCSFKQTIIGTPPTTLFALSTAMHQFEQRPVMEASIYDRFVGYGDPAADLDDGETFALGDRMTDPSDGVEYRCSVAGTAGDDGGATATGTAPTTTITVANGTLLAAGQHIRIAGAGAASGNHDTRIVSKTSATVIEIEDATITTVAGTAISFLNPTFVAVDVS